MAVKTFCTVCKARVNAPDAAIGLEVPCPRCGARVPIGEPVCVTPFEAPYDPTCGAVPSSGPVDFDRKTQLSQPVNRERTQLQVYDVPTYSEGTMSETAEALTYYERPVMVQLNHVLWALAGAAVATFVVCGVVYLTC